MMPSWNPRRPIWTKQTAELLRAKLNDCNSTIPLSTILHRSDNFPLKFPTETNRCKTLKQLIDVKTLERNINSAYPVIHENILYLCAKFLLHKRMYGSKKEKSLYNSMNLIQFINRLLTKRAVTFVGNQDYYLLLDGTEGLGNWERIGTAKDKEPSVMKNLKNWITRTSQSPLTLEKCLSYDEMKLSAFLSVSSYTYFVNDGRRANCGKYFENRWNVHDEGVIIGIIGPRLTKEETLEYQEIIITKQQNCIEKGYGDCKPPSIHKLFADFYEENCDEFNEKRFQAYPIEANPRYIRLNKQPEIFDNHLYYKRLVFSIDTLFMEANQRASEKIVMAYIHVVGIGLGMWRKTKLQDKVFLDACAERIQILGSKLKHVSDICFVDIQHDSCGDFKNDDLIPIRNHPNQGIKIHLNKRNPHTRLTGDHSEKLLVVSYIWNGNALPGNEYWCNNLAFTTDAAAATSSQIAELHNPFINPKICGENLHVVTPDGIVTIQQYWQKLIMA